MAKILYQNKVALNPQPSIPNENKVTDADMNEIKTSVNYLYDYPIDVGTSGITNGTDQCVLFESGGKVEQSILFKFDPVTGRFNINNVASPTAQINLKATNDMAGSNWLVLRNSTDTFNRVQFRNDGTMVFRAAGAGSVHSYNNSSDVNKIQIGIGSNEGYFLVNGSFMSTSIVDNRNASAGVYGKGKFWIGGQATTPSLPSESSTNVLFISDGTAPNIAMTGAVQQYTEVIGGVAYPHWMFDNGQKVSLQHYQDAAFANTPNTGDANTDDLITALVTALTNMNLIGV